MYGVGINDADYRVHKTEWVNGRQRTVWTCPFYGKWVAMLCRCYSANFNAKHPSYSECIVAGEWLVFSAFKQWMEALDWEGKELDKDLRSSGNKIYGPGHCLFLDKRVNSFLVECTSKRGSLPIGVSFHKKQGLFQSRCNSVAEKKLKFLGWFKTEEEAHHAWLSFKQKQALVLATQQTNPEIAQYIIERYKNYGELDG